MKTTVVIFPGSNCDRDVIHAVQEITGEPVEPVWHKEDTLPSDTDLVILPGGFSYGDYLRCGAMASTSPIMKAVRDHASSGKLLLGICNGFQVLTESRLLPGSLLSNKTLTFICKRCYIRVERKDTPFTSLYNEGQVLQFPIAHHEGLYFLPPGELGELEDNGQVVFRYCSPDGKVSSDFNPNGALNNIAGVTNREGNILGLMPHPERASEGILGGTDGALMWRSVKKWLERGGA
ncbi:MAG: phosphoribosylformylglycinamidine synthase subunit PurQ [Synergistales bacterium]|nr:phosphoribosylformylglycinamidine synthase subunit PurQ [Synergistales bacterium]